MTADRRPLATPDEVTTYLGIAKQTLYNWRLKGVGPRVVKVGGRLRYRWADVEKWLDQKAQVAA